MPNRTAVVVLAAGAGTRMRSKTPKVLHELAGRSLLGHALHAADAVDPDHLITVIGHDRERVGAAVSALADELGRKIDVAVQEQQLGTGHAVQCALEALPDDYTGDILVTNADVPLLDGHTLDALLHEHRSYPGQPAVTVLSFVPPDPNGYGRIVRNPDGQVAEIVEHADATPEQAAITEVNSGVYVVRRRGAAGSDRAAAAGKRAVRAVPDRCAEDRARTRPLGVRRGARRPGQGDRRQRPGAARAGGRGAEPPSARAPYARGRHRHGPDLDLGRLDRRDRPRRGAAAGRATAREHRDRRGRRDRARHDAARRRRRGRVPA